MVELHRNTRVVGSKVSDFGRTTIVPVHLIHRLWQALDRHRRNVDVIVPTVATVVTGVLTAWVMSRHVIVNYDSIYYLSSANNLADGRGLVDYTGREMTNFPPGYTLLISFFTLFGADVVTSARLWEVLAAMAIVVLSSLIAHRLGPRGSAAVAAGLTATIPAFLAMNVQIMSESLFAVAFLVVIVTLIRLPEPPAHLGVRHLAPVIVASWVCCLLRYQGYAVVVATAVILLLRAGTRRERVRSTAIYSIGAGAVIAGIVVQSTIRTGSLGAPITPPKGTFFDDVSKAFSFAGHWSDYTPTWLPLMSRELAGFLTVAVGSAALVAIVWRLRSALQVRMVLAFLIYTAALIAVTLVSARRVWVDITPRMAFALLPLVVILVAVFVGQSLNQSKNLVRGVTAAALVLVLGLGTLQTLDGASRVRAQTRGSASIEQQVPELGRAVADLPDDAIIYSNNPEGIWYSSRKPVVHRLDTWTTLVINLSRPGRQANTPESFNKRLFEFRDRLCTGFYLAWTDWQHESRPANSVENLDVFADVTLVETVPGGTLYFAQSTDERLCADATEVTP